LETIIIHLKTDNNPHNVQNSVIGQKIPNTNLQYKDYYYNGNIIPSLGNARGKIAFFYT